jgi:3-dehydroquinate dehydratase/shikimate dehydrogenase
MVTKLAVSIFAQTPEQALSQAAVAAERGADIIEFRLDRCSATPSQIAELVRKSPLPVIVSCRPPCEGGEYRGAESDRIAILQSAADAEPAYVDIELDSMNRPQSLDGFILSKHDVESRPSNLIQSIARMSQDDRCSVIKVAWRARSLRDNLEAFELLRNRQKPMIALCMGPFGLLSRVLAKKFGAFLTYAGLDDHDITAPGQVGAATMKNLYRWDHLDQATQVYGVIGWPAEQSQSPHLHNAGLSAINHHGVYLPLPIPPEYEHFKATVGSFLDDKHLDFRGASVTSPHKENLIRFVKERGGVIDPLAEKIGSANTLVAPVDGSILAANTDYDAALDTLRREMIAGKRISVLGAGGIARTIVASFVHHGAQITIHNRTPEKARTLAMRFGVDSGGDPFDADIIINATTVGMHPNVYESPLESWPEKFDNPPLVFDTIYNPRKTKLLRDADSHGCQTISGLEMFVRQAESQFALWTGHPPPEGLFASIMEKENE